MKHDFQRAFTALTTTQSRPFCAKRFSARSRRKICERLSSAVRFQRAFYPSNRHSRAKNGSCSGRTAQRPSSIRRPCRLRCCKKRWLKAISLDPRIRLFDFDSSGLEDVPPLFTPDDIYIFDRYADGDPFEDEVYIQIFHRILDAIKKRYPLSIDVKKPPGGPHI